MSVATERSVKMLLTALTMEEKGKEFYRKAAQETQNELGREIWQILADYEDEHIKKIHAINDQLKGGRGWQDSAVSWTAVTDLGQVFRKLASEQKEHIRADTSDVEALGVGMDFESASLRFYEEQLVLAEDPIEKKFIELMVAEERGHLNLLSDMQLYYKDPESWFLEKDRVHLDGA